MIDFKTIIGSFSAVLLGLLKVYIFPIVICLNVGVMIKGNLLCFLHVLKLRYGQGRAQGSEITNLDILTMAQ